MEDSEEGGKEIRAKKEYDSNGEEVVRGKIVGYFTLMVAPWY